MKEEKKEMALPRVDGVLIHRNGDMDTMNVNCPEENLFKRCGFKTADGFKVQTSWKTPRGTSVVLYAKAVGKANTENQYEFPPPVASTLFFGKCLLLQKLEGGALTDLAVDDWNKICDNLVGGVESIGSESEEERSVDDVDEDATYTKEGYLMDGFVVADDELEEEPYTDTVTHSNASKE